ncbi:TPA: ribose-phosphate pyrophosphokinase [archaeon]|nr:ribose-phosphate pyrophosphokinase [Candidatus Naiadarchaeales archaeon SRR2090153.bin1042]
MKQLIVPCSNAVDLATKLATELKTGVVQYESRKFPDGENYFRIDTDLSGSEAVILQSGYPNPNDSVIELLLAADACKEQKARKVTAVVPYFPYARQDKRFKLGEAFSLEIIAKFLKNSGIKRIITADAHFRDDYVGYNLFSLRGTNISGGSLLAHYIKAKFSLNKLHIISPDFGASELVKQAAENTDSTHSALKKKRTSDYQVEMTGTLNVQGKNVLVLDDMISTGNTMIKAVELCKQNGAARVFAAASHGLFVSDALWRLRSAAEYVVTTDSVKNETAEVSLAHEIVNVL